MVEHSFSDIFSFDWWFRRGRGMTRDGFLVTLSFALRRPLEFMLGGVKEFTEWETTMEKFEVKDMEFKEDRLEVVQLTVNPH